VPRGRRHAFACLLLIGLLAASRSGADDAVFPSRQVSIEVVVRGSIAAVTEDYFVTRPITTAVFQLLVGDCSRVGRITGTLDGHPMSFDVTRKGPWQILRGTIGAAHMEGDDCHVQYEVRLGDRDSTVPILLPAAPLERAEGSRGAAVTLHVPPFADRSVPTVLLPRLEPDSVGLTGRFLAVPSIVRIRVPSMERSPCDVSATGTTGGLEWRFWIFAGTMAVWVPFYLWWFGLRGSEPA